MLTTLAFELSLTPPQREAVEQILRDRVEEIRTCHDRIRKAQLLDIRHYDWQVAKMKEDWFRRIDGLLNRDQHARFSALAASGLFNEGLGVNEEPGMTVLD